MLLFQASGNVIGVAVDGLFILAPDDVTDTTNHGSHCDSRHADGSVAYVAVADRFPYIMACNGSHNCGKRHYCLCVGTSLAESSLVITRLLSSSQISAHGPLTRYAKLWVRMRRECRERYVSDPEMHHGTRVTHVP